MGRGTQEGQGVVRGIKEGEGRGRSNKQNQGPLNGKHDDLDASRVSTKDSIVSLQRDDLIDHP